METLDEKLNFLTNLGVRNDSWFEACEEIRENLLSEKTWQELLFPEIRNNRNGENI